MPNTSDVTANIRELIIQLHRGNRAEAEPLVEAVATELKAILLSGLDPQSLQMQQAQQTMFAIDEARTLMGQQDLGGALEAARDAGKEWKAPARRR
ncbi:MAG: hypothetical protein HYX27_10675 [Acidobacteria bacterium]|nr:hypothetical protein [Acidobacteriota bacterium]